MLPVRNDTERYTEWFDFPSGGQLLDNFQAGGQTGLNNGGVARADGMFVALPSYS